MQNTKNKSSKGFSLVELLVVITIIGILASAGMAGYSAAVMQARIRNSANNVGQISKALRVYANDNDGWFPTQDDQGMEFGTSTQAFDFLLKSETIDTEAVFWMPTKNPDKNKKAPDENKNLTAQENVYGYVKGLSDTSFSLSPLAFEGLMDGPGSYGQFHPWLAKKKAVIGFVDTHVSTMTLTTNQPGATVRDDSGKIQNIFQKRESTADGASGGYLDAEPDAVLLPN